MALTKFTQNMDIIAKLDDEPNDAGGLSAAELKARFDEGGLALQNYINEILTPEVEAEVARLDREKVTEEDLRQAVLGQVPDDSITLEKMADDFFENYYSKSDALTAQQVRTICT